MAIEQHSINYIPETERYGKPRDLFTVWFGANLNLTTIVTGAVLVMMGLNLFWSIASITLGTLLGTIFVASHSVQGPRLGIPQMIQSRAQFGVLGAIIPMVFVMFVYLGFGVANTLLVSQTLTGVTALSPTWVIILFTLISILIAIYGYKLIHITQRWLSISAFIVLGIATIIAFRLPLPAGAWRASAFDLTLFVSGVGIIATYVLAMAPYVADYSRYLPSNASSPQVFWFTYGGLTLSGIWMMTIGAVLAAVLPDFVENSGGGLAGLFHGYRWILYILIIYGLLAINVFNFYGAFMSIVTSIQPFSNLKVTPLVRSIILSAILVINIVLSLLGGQGDFMTFFINFIYFMSYFLIPWTAINLVDFFLLRKGEYHIKDIFDIAGRYGKYNRITIFAFLISITAEIPFINSTFYVGSIAKMLDGADLAWLVGLVTAVVLYYFPMKAKQAESINEEALQQIEK
ncbi:sulfonate ABC transporter substrate-binding protein [Brenneria goodwinii]|uniref:Sulfonate ABC transporter substrate-binding protein n=1 Tax=Brenneria goodwinii TaxID=1109412 RepID=A0AAE8JKZ7_9GAMM|nr:cytosine permease [Brenneria goodwinii]ATA24594.1 sulfonate ABC transporter substrate-binding protein [Brenneria goodwinii]RLM16859.1 sulfonate ABC transporter substrate-binding protein [Brenneria goodwinii]